MVGLLCRLQFTSHLVRMALLLLVCYLSVSVAGQQAQHDWVDPYDMLNYDASTKTMREPAQPSSYHNVNTKRRAHIGDGNQVDEQLNPFDKIHYDSSTGTMRKPVQKVTQAVIPQEPACNPVLRRFFKRLLKDIKMVGEPSDSSEVIYDAKIKLTKQAMTEIQNLLEGEDLETGALDNAISQILVELKLHSYMTVKWRFEDTFGIELDTLLKMGLFILLVVAIVCTHLWSVVSWFVRFRRIFAVSFFVSIIWNWFYLYKIAFAEHQNNLVKMDNFNAKCTGVKKIDWSDSLKEWFRSTWTLQDDPCQTYYEVLMVNPVLLVPPTKALTVTITTFFTEPLKHIGQGISEFLRALLKDLPITLQIPVLVIVMVAIVVCMYGGVQATFQHGIMAPLRPPRGDPPPEVLDQPAHRLQIQNQHNRGGGDAQAPPPQPADLPAEEHVHEHRGSNNESPSNHIHRVQPNSAQPKATPARMVVETLRNTEDRTDAKQREKKTQALDPSTSSDSEKKQEAVQLKAATTEGAAADTVKTKAKESDTMKSTKKAKKEEIDLGKPRSDGTTDKQERQSEVQEQGASNEQVENVGVSVEETSPME